MYYKYLTCILAVSLQFLYQILLFILLIFPVRLIGYILLIPISFYMARKVYTANKSQVRLPTWCRWYDCLENYQPVVAETLNWTNDDGLLGDLPYRGIRGTLDIQKCSILKLAYEIYTWIGIRNKTEYLCGVTLGFEINLFTDVKVIAGSKEQIDDGLRSGYRIMEATLSNGKKYYMLYIICRYWNFDKCFRFKIGYKIDAIGSYYQPYSHVMSIISINPLNKWNHEV